MNEYDYNTDALIVYARVGVSAKFVKIWLEICRMSQVLKFFTVLRLFYEISDFMLTPIGLAM